MLDAVTGLISLQIARSRLALHRAGLWLAVGVVASIAVSTLTVVSVWLLVDGLAHGARALLADAPWLGTALAGAVGLGSLALALRFGFGRVERRVLERLLRQADAEDSQVASQRAERPS